VLCNDADAEDAFQATFLVLAARAGSIHDTATLAGWLHGVARRVALQSLAASARRRKHEVGAPAPQPSDPAHLSWAAGPHILHGEVSALSARHREPLLLCHLQGKTHAEAAVLLGLSKGTLKRRLERGRTLLRARLTRRGLGSAGVLLASVWPAPAGVPEGLL